MNKDIGEILCNAVDVIVNKRIESLSFDKTIICTIIDDSRKNKGYYTVTNREVEFETYSENHNYNKDDQVYVLIPDGDYSSPQKTIISKYKINEDEQKTIYTSPFKQLVLMKELFKDSEKKYSLIVNDPENKREILIKDIILSNDINPNNNLCLGIKANFTCPLQDYAFINGEYGISLELFDDTLTQSIKKTFSSKDMFGNPFAYSQGNNQEGIINISDIGFSIHKIIISFYQSNKFYTIDNREIDTSTMISVSDLALYSAHDISTEPKEGLRIYSQTDNFYDMNNNIKNIDIIWYHLDENNNYIGFPEEDDNNKIVIELYYYTQGKWEKFTETPLIRNEFNFTTYIASLNLDKKSKQKQIKAILKQNNKNYDSNIFIFTNLSFKDDNLEKPNNSALTIALEDKAQKYYSFYNQNNNIINPQDSIVDRKLSLVFSSSDLKISTEDFVKNAEEIKWMLPISQTMLTYDKENTEAFKIEKDDNNIIFSPTDKKNTTFSFRVSSLYDKSAINNTIKCTVKYEGVLYTAETSFTFSSQTDDNDYTVYVSKSKDDLENEENLELYVYDPKNEEVNLDNYLEGINWYSINIDNTQELIYSGQKKCPKPVWDENKTNLLKITIDSIGINKTTYYKIIYKKYDNLSATVPDFIYYGKTGNAPSYYKGEFKLFKDGSELTNGKDIEGSDLNQKIQWEINYFNNVDPNLLPKKSENQNNLKVPNLVITNSVPIVLKAYVLSSSSNEKIYLWKSPIYIIASIDSDRALDNSEEAIKISQNEAILNIAAGAALNDQNTLSGVFMGEVSQDDNSSFGLYSYNKGIQNFKLNTDGALAIGSDEQFRIDKDSKCTLSGWEVLKNKIQLNNDIFLSSESNEEIIKITDNFLVNNEGTATISNIYIDNGYFNTFYLKDDYGKYINYIPKEIKEKVLSWTGDNTFYCQAETPEGLIDYKDQDGNKICISIPKYELVDNSSYTVLSKKEEQ